MAEETFTVEFVERELVAIELAVIDIIKKTYITALDDTTITNPQNGDILVREDGYWVNKALEELESEIPNFIFNEFPTKLSSKRFQTINIFRTGTLRVFLNGLKEKNITIIDSTTFELPIDSITSDTIEVSYIKE